MTFNICGAVCRDGEVPDTAAHVVRRVLDGDLDVAFLQEVCRGQFQRIKASLRKKGYTALFARTAADARCDGDAGHGKGFGVALLVRGEAGRPVRLALPVGAGYERRSMLGATATIGGRMTFVASVHASPSVDAGRDAQLDAVARYLDAKAPMPTIVGGDFNTLPGDPAMARFYAPRAGGTGRYLELDELRDGTPTRSGRPTYNTVPRKIDYIFFSGAHFRTPRANVIRTSMSDHSVYLGGVRTVRD
jgi:endonuclease/exonuclease/phosphatase family metal-dependent hydrolase